MRTARYARHPRGVTLVELMATLAVLAVLMTVAAPSFAGMLRRAAAATAFHQLTAALASARIAAVSRGHPVTVCPSRDGAACRKDLDWSEGWIVYLDPDRAEQPAGPHAVLQVIASSPRHVDIRATAGRHRVRYQPSGMSGGNNTTLRLCSRHERHLLGAVIVNNAGRPRSQREDAPTPCPFTPAGT